MMKSWLQIGSLIFMLGFACATQDTRQDSTPSLTSAQMRDDFAYLRDTWAPLDKSFSADERQSFMSIVEESIARADTFTPSEFALEVSRAVAVSGNGHT
ncbi:MAG: peptidase S41, partial [Acidobacteria bacterium]|nr:peptidase S41 [Acidobacteriota bacterium]